MTQHPEAEAKLVAELREHGLLATPEQPTPRPIQWDDIPKLTYLQAALKASGTLLLRLHAHACLHILSGCKG